MTTLPSDDVAPHFGMGLVNYILGDQLPKVKPGETMEQCIEAIAAIPMGSKLYIRPTWRQMQSQPGKLDPFDAWKITLEMAEKYNKPLGFRIFLSNPDIEEESLPDFVLEKVPSTTSARAGTGRERAPSAGNPRPRNTTSAALPSSRTSAPHSQSLTPCWPNNSMATR